MNRSLPLGIDIGTTRIRVALAERDENRSLRLRAVVARDLPDGAATSATITDAELVAALLDEIVAELGTRERRCIVSVGAPEAALRAIRFPRMSWTERSRAARFEAQRFAGWDLAAIPSVVRVHPIDRNERLYAVGIVQAAALSSRTQAAKLARLRVVGVDYDAFALRRAIGGVDAIVDIGSERTLVHTFGAHGPLTWHAPAGGNDITRGIARELSIDVNTAEKRKRILGSTGAGIGARHELARQIAALIDRARARSPIERIALTGNGARLPHLAKELEEVSGALVEIPVPDVLRGDAYPDDVVRAAAPDWTLAAALSGWSAAA